MFVIPLNDVGRVSSAGKLMVVQPVRYALTTPMIAAAAALTISQTRDFVLFFIFRFLSFFGTWPGTSGSAHASSLKPSTSPLTLDFTEMPKCVTVVGADVLGRPQPSPNAICVASRLRAARRSAPTDFSIREKQGSAARETLRSRDRPSGGSYWRCGRRQRGAYRRRAHRRSPCPVHPAHRRRG